MASCDICVEHFTATLNKRIECKYCEFACCKTCFKRWITDAEHPMQCMACKQLFTRIEIMAIMGSTFMSNEYKKYKEEVVYDQQKALMPATQTELEQELLIANLWKDYEKMRIDHEDAITQFKKGITDFQNDTTETTQSNKDVFKKFNKLQEELKLLGDTNEHTARKFRTSIFDKADALKGKPMKMTYVKQCPSESCNALLSLENTKPNGDMECSVCRIACCKDCMELVKPDEEHKCDSDILQTVELLKKDTKPCPSCGVPIHKIEGCFAPKTLIPLYDGFVKLVEDIQVGDLLKGPDGMPRKVLAVCNGTDQMYKVTQSKGATYIVNSKHKLCLVDHNNKEVRLTVSSYLDLEMKDKDVLYGYRVKSIDDRIIEKSTISVEPYGSPNGQYYGFLLDRDHKFLFTDDTVMSNCDQMYCVSCHTAFSWKTLKIDNGRIHNPHHFEYLRRNGGVLPPRDPLDIVCGQQLDANMAAILYRRYNVSIANVEKKNVVLYRSMNDAISMYIRYAIHFRRVLVPKYTRNTLANSTKTLRKRLLNGEINLDNFKVQVQRLDKKAEKNRELLDVVSMVERCITDIVFRMLEDDSGSVNPFKNLFKYHSELKGLETYTNECLDNIRKSFGGTHYTLRLLAIM